MTNQQLKAHCEDVIANQFEHWEDWVVDMAKEALAALTQPASPALRLPDAFSPHDAKMFCAARGVAGAYELASQMANYAVDKVVRLNAPHTAPIEPICATGGAEWTDKQFMEFLTIAFRYVDISGDILMDDIRLGVKMATQQVRN